MCSQIFFVQIFFKEAILSLVLRVTNEASVALPVSQKSFNIIFSLYNNSFVLMKSKLHHTEAVETTSRNMLNNDIF